MKLLVFGAVAACLFVALASRANAQDDAPTPQKHLAIYNSAGRVRLAASSMQRNLSVDGNANVIQLKGNVEIKTAAMVLHANEADYHEDTGEIEVRGNVRMKLENQK